MFRLNPNKKQIQDLTKYPHLDVDIFRYPHLDTCGYYVDVDIHI